VYPPCSRLFVSVGTTISQAAIEEKFSKYGEIEETSVPFDKVKRQPRGYAFVKFKKTSEAALALAALNQTPLECDGNQMNPMKIAVSGSRKEEGSKDSDIEPTRLIVCMPQKTELDEIRGLFSKFGNIVDVTHTKSDNKKAILKYSTFREAAICYENCDKSYRANFLLPRTVKKETEQLPQGGSGGYGNAIVPLGLQSNNMMQFPSSQGNQNKVMVVFNPALSKDYLSSLFNIVPGFLDTSFHKLMADGSALGSALYDNPQSAAHAVSRLNGFEYPIGTKLQVYFGADNSQVENLLSTIKEATTALKESGIDIAINGLPDSDYANYGYGNGRMDGIAGGGGGILATPNSFTDSGYNNASSYNNASYSNNSFSHASRGMDSMLARIEGRMDVRGRRLDSGDKASISKVTERICSAVLPSPKETISQDADVEQRLFFIIRECTERVILPEMITDLFCRFGELINAHVMKGKRCGYARYGSAVSAEHCIQTLQGARFYDGSLKVQKAEPEKYTWETKKRKFYD